MASTKKQLRHIMLGKPTVLPMSKDGGPSSLKRFERVMARLRLQEPMPFPVDELLGYLLPKDFMHLDTRVAQSAASPQEQNVLSLIQVNRDETVHHVRLAPGGTVNTFWFRARVLHSAYAELKESADLLMPPCPAFATLSEWMQRAWAIERDIDAATSVMERLIKVQPNPRMVYSSWPQLQSILKLPLSGAGAYASERDTRRVLESIPLPQKERIAHQFAECLMLPEDRRTHAWVGRHYGYGET